MAMTDEGLSFAELEKRIRAMPDGPAAILDMPRWLIPFTVAGVIGVIAGLLPSLLIEFLEPQMWMVYVSKAGLWIAVLGFAPEFFRGIAVVALGFLRWKSDQVKQLDHDLVQFRGLIRWLVEFPRDLLEEHQRFARNVQNRLTSKLGLLAGSIDKLGAIPILLVLAIQLKTYFDPGAVPYWQILVALFLAITYLIAWVGAHMRLRVQLYEVLLSEALAKKGG
ncbi:hypothetical protein [Luteimonas cucumeris]|nr:hypothetical protein [Luteimonas cucumeris]